MALRLEDKKALVSEVNEVALRAHSVVAAEYRGLTVAQLTDLRAKARASRVYMRVVKNTLARRAVAGTQFECVGDKLKGPLILAFSEDDPGAAARLMRGFAKDHEKLVPTLVSLGGSGAVQQGPRACRESAHEGAGARAAAGCAQGAHRQVRAHARRASREARADDRRGQGPEAGGRLRRLLVQLSGINQTFF